MHRKPSRGLAGHGRNRDGTPDERMLAYYYNGIVYSFSGDSEQEMQNYLKAERFAEKAENKRAAGRLYKAKMAVYNKVYDYKAAIEEGKTAARYYLESSDTARYLSAINDIVAVSDLAEDSLTRMENLKILENHRNLLTSRQRSNLYSIRILFAIDSDSISQVDSLVSEYLENIKDSSIIQWSTLSYAYLSTEKYKEAGSSLEHYARFSGKKELDYYWMYASLQEALSNPAEALSAYKTYMKMLDEEKVSIFQNDTKFLEERRDAKIRSDNYILYIIIISLTLVIICLVSVLLYQKVQKVKWEKAQEAINHRNKQNALIQEKEAVEKMYASLKTELNRLKKIRKDNKIDPEVQLSVEKRLNVLNMFVLAELSASFRHTAYEELNRMMEDREGFILSTTKTFMISHPGFISYLKSKNLSELEVGYCCMYCIGFNGSELSEYINKKGIYNINGIIRQKLGIPKGGMHISIFLRQKMEESG